MNYREVGRTGVRVSEIGFGCGGTAGLMVKGSAAEQRAAVERAIELGINYFDEAPDYGDGVSETNLGRALKELGVRPYLTTKAEVRAHNLDDIAGHVVRTVEESLRRLGMDYIDFLQIHNGPLMERPALSGRVYTHLWIEDYLRPGGALDGLQRVQRSGMARFIGFITRGNDGPAARQLIDTGAFDLINVSVNLLNPSAALKPYGTRIDPDWDGILGYAAEHGVGAAIYAPLAGGLLTDNAVQGGARHPMSAAQHERDPAATAARLGKARALAFLSQPGERTLAEAAMQFCLSVDGVSVVLGGFSDQEQLEEGVGSSRRGRLSELEMARIEMVWRSCFSGEGSTDA